MSKKELLAKVIDNIMPDIFFKKLIDFCGDELIVLAYHRIMDVDENYPFDIELISASCNQFDEQMEFISKYFQPVTVEQVVKCAQKKISLPNKAILITFDDGFEDNYINAFPILKKYNVPATIFLSTDFISSNETLWFDRLSYFVMNYKEAPMRTALKEKFNIGNEIQSRRELLEKVMEYVKVIPNTKRVSLLHELYEQYNFTYRDSHMEYSTTLSWEQVREMDKSCVSFGSHTLSHPILSQLDDSELMKELALSKRLIEEELGHKIETIAYPVGTKSAFNDKVISCAKESDYSLGFSYLSGANSWPLKNIFTINRYHIERYISTSLFKCMLSMQKIFLN